MQNLVNTVQASTLPASKYTRRSGPSKRITVDRLPINPSNWINVLNAILWEHNERHATLVKNVSFKTMKERKEFYFRFFRELRGIGYKLDPRSLGTRHIQAGVNLWLSRDLSAGTMLNYLSYLRALGNWIRKPGLVRSPAFYVPDAQRIRRSTVAISDKSWTAADVNAEELIAAISVYAPYVGVQLEVCMAFGLRVREAVMLQPHLAVVAAAQTNLPNPEAEVYLHISRGSKGKRVRFIPIDSDRKRAALARAQAWVKGQESHLGDPAYPNLQRNKERFYRVMTTFGVTCKRLGITAHGLRHEYANDRYELFSGAVGPLRGGTAVDPLVDAEARLRVAQELGHARKQISSAYLGSPVKNQKPAG